MLIQLSILIFLAQSGAEWKLVRSNAWCKRNFEGTRGIIISGVISVVLGLFALNISPTFGGAFAIAGIFGVFTNELTFAFYEGIHNFWHKARGGVENVKTWKATNASRLEDAKVGIQGIFSGIVSIFVLLGKVIRFTGWLFTRPAAINAQIKSLRTQPALTK